MQKNPSTYLSLVAVVSALAAPSALASQVLGGVLPADLGIPLPIGLGGAAALTGVGLIVGVQLIKRRNDRK